MFFTKQTAVWFLVPIFYELIKEIRIKNKGSAALLGAGAFISLATWIIGLWIWGVLPSFYEWAIKFGIFILPKASGQIQFPDFRNMLVSAFPFLIFIPLVLKSKFKNLNLLIWAGAGALGAFPRFEFFHFQPSLPFLAFATGVVSSEFGKTKGLMRIFLICYIVGNVFLISGYLLRNWGEGTRFNEPSVQEVVSYVKENTTPGEKIFVMNWWDSVYALTDTLPAAKPWVPQLPWYQELPGIQDKEVGSLVESRPKIILLSPYSQIGLSAYVPQKVFGFVQSRYNSSTRVDGIEILIPKK